MQHTEDQIVQIANIILKDINFPIIKGDEVFGNKIDGAIYKENFIPLLGRLKGKETAVWLVFITQKKELFDEKSSFLYIEDETGHPIYMQTSWVSVIEIDIDKNGKFIRINEPEMRE